VLAPPGRHGVTPAASDGDLGRRGERLPVLILDQILGPDIDQPDARARRGKEVRCVAPALPASVEVQFQRLGDYVGQVGGEVQGQQQPGLFQALEPVMPAGTDQELKPGTMMLVPPPGEPAHRTAVDCRRLHEVPYRARLALSAGLPGDRPSVGPVPAQLQAGRPRPDGHRDQELVPPAAMRPQRPS